MQKENKTVSYLLLKKLELVLFAKVRKRKKYINKKGTCWYNYFQHFFLLIEKLPYLNFPLHSENMKRNSIFSLLLSFSEE